MKPRYTPIYFKPQELVTPYVFQRLGDAALTVMDDRLLIALDAVRNMVDRPITVNNWHIGGAFDERGFRDEAIGGNKLSQHRFGRAVDFDVEGLSPEMVRQMIVSTWKYSEDLRHITAIERGVNWVHIDVRPIQVITGPMIFNP